MMSTGSEASSKHLPALDGLRGVAVSLVFAFHLGLIPGGFIGVDVFFVISGFLITGLLVAEQRAQGRVRYGRFWSRRARRLLPAMLLLLSGVSIWAKATHHLGGEGLRLDALATLGYCANWRAIFIGSDYWELFRRSSPLEHTWSLAIEEQYYLVWPFIVVLALRLRTKARALFWTALVIAVASAVAMFVMFDPRQSTTRIYYGTDTRAFAFALGSALGALPRELQRRRGRALDIGAALSAFGLAVFASTVSGGAAVVYRGGLVAVALGATALVACTAYAESGVVSRALSFAPLRMLGRISYGVYLWHWPVIIALSEHGRVATVAVTIALAMLSYVIVEKPIRGGAFGGRARWFVVPAVLTATLGFVFIGTETRPGTSSQLRSDTPIVSSESNQRSRLPLNVLLVGDSVGRSLGTSVGAFERFENRAVDGCGLRRDSQRLRFDGRITGRTDCGDWHARWPNDVAQVDPDVVILALVAPVFGEVEMDGTWVLPCDGAFEEKYLALMDEALRVLSVRGAAVLVTLSPYIDDPTKGFVAPGSGTVQSFATNRQRTDCVNAVVRTAVRRNPRAEWLDLARRHCPSRECVPLEGDIELRPDGTHYSPAGARLVMNWIEAELARLPIRRLRSRPTPAAPETTVLD